MAADYKGSVLEEVIAKHYLHMTRSYQCMMERAIKAHIKAYKELLKEINK